MEKTGVTLSFTKDRDTKNTVRFAETVAEGDPSRIDTIYVQKHFLKDLGYKDGDTVNVTVEVVKGG